MASKSKRKADVAEVTKVQFDTAVKVYEDNSRSLLDVNAQMQAEMDAIGRKYSDQIQNLEQVQGAQFEVIKNFALANKDSLFSEKKKSMVIGQVVMGLRKDTPSVKLLTGKSWEDVIKALKNTKPNLVRTVEEVNKAEVIAKRDELAADMKSFGIKIQQNEKFFIALTDKKETPAAEPVEA